MSQGTSVRSQIRSLIADPNIRTSFTLIPITNTIGSKGGYDPSTEEEGTSRTVFSVPSNIIPNKLGLLKIGDLKQGELRLLIRDDEVIKTDDKVTFQSNEYHIREIRKIVFNEVTVAQSMTLSKKLS